MMKVQKEIENIDADRRKVQRKTVLLKCSIQISGFSFDAVVYDLSLYGAKVKIDLPISDETLLMIRIKDNQFIPARVAWSSDGFMGLEFRRSPGRVKSILGRLASRMDEAEQ